MTPRSRVRAILNRQPVDRLPVDMWHTDEVEQALHRHFGTTDALALYQRMGLDKIVWFSPIYNAPDGSGPTGSLHFTAANCTMWGTPLKTMQAGAATYQEFGTPPLSEYDVPEALDDYPYWPDVERFDYEAMTAVAAAAAEHFVAMGPWISLFEVYCQLRGLETALGDLIRRPGYVQAVLDRIEGVQTALLRRFLRQAAGYLDLVFISDDMASQDNLLISPRMWDRYFQARLTRWCDLIHEHDLKVFYHTDGAAEPLLPRLIDAGIDVLNPIQHVCPGMDCATLKAKYGERLIFHGAIDNQHVLPFGTPQDVAEETRRCMATLGADERGYIVSSCHNIQAGTPVENIVAMIETVTSQGVRL